MLTNPKKFLDSLPNKPGIYQMCDAGHHVLYVGKAKNLKKRLRSYFYSVKDPKTSAFMAQVKSIEIIITSNENAALLLESNLIKTLKPRYNILFKDDKSFPYLFLSQHEFPRLEIFRGPVKKSQGKYFGPFPSASAVNLTLKLLQKIFRLRVCKDSFLRNRTRACMLYQIKLCSAPCVGCINKEEYAKHVKFVYQFLCNKSDVVVGKFTKLMDEAAVRLDYEQAANYRDQISSIRKVQIEQAITKDSGNIDVIALVANEGAVCVEILFVRNGLLLGNKSYFPSAQKFNLSHEEVLATFITQHYLQSEVDAIVPDKLLLNIKLPNRLGYASVLSKKFKRKITVSDFIRGAQKQLITTAEVNALNALKARYVTAMDYSERLLGFKKTLHLPTLPRRIECFDVSHTMGEAQVVACVVFNESGCSKSDYRKFNVKTASICDDYAALSEALLRRYCDKKNLPDVVLIDGGKGQLNIASRVLRKLQIQNILLMTIAKGKERKPGLEEIYIAGRENTLILSPHDPVLHFIQQIRDEAHRFAISGHRRKMIKLRRQSVLGGIVGVGKAKQAILLKHFGGLTELKSAGIDDLVKIKGVSFDLAQRIYEYLHAQ
jgi:excinuclease ABC subunit C